MPRKEKDEVGGPIKSPDTSQEWYIGCDGDGMGNTVEEALLHNDVKKSQEFEQQIKAAFADIRAYISSNGGVTLFEGGDNGFYTIDGNPKEIGEKLREIYLQHTDHTLSVGVGHEPIESHKALVLCKNTGKDKVIVWNEDQEESYQEVQKQQEALEDCEKELREDSDFDLQSSPALKYKAKQAQTHYSRLRGVGYDHKTALDFVERLYKLSDSYRDVLVQRQKSPLTGNTPAEAYLRNGEEQWKSYVENGFNIPASSEETNTMPSIGQKLVTKNDFGRVAFVGSRFVSVEWLGSEKRERIALSRFKQDVSDERVVLLPQVRTANRAQIARRV